MAPYRHFVDKDDLLAAICDAGFEMFVQVLSGARMEGDSDFQARLMRMGLAYVRFAANHPAHYQVMFGSSEAKVGQEHWRKSGARAFELLEQTIREGQASGDVRTGDSTELAFIVWSMVHGISLLRQQSDLDDGSAGARTVLLAGGILTTGLRGLHKQAGVPKKPNRRHR